MLYHVTYIQQSKSVLFFLSPWHFPSCMQKMCIFCNMSIFSTPGNISFYRIFIIKKADRRVSISIRRQILFGEMSFWQIYNQCKFFLFNLIPSTVRLLLLQKIIKRRDDVISKWLLFHEVGMGSHSVVETETLTVWHIQYQPCKPHHHHRRC